MLDRKEFRDMVYAISEGKDSDLLKFDTVDKNETIKPLG